MPGNNGEDGIHNLYELDNYSRDQHLRQTVGGDWTVLDNNQRVAKPIHTGTVPNFNLKNYRSQQLGSVKGHVSGLLQVPLDENCSPLTPRLEYSTNFISNNLLTANEFLPGCHNFQSNQNQPGLFVESTCYDQRILNSKGFPVLKSQLENECADSPTLTTNSERSEITEASSDFNFLRGQRQFARDQELSASQNYPMQQPGYNDMQLLQQHMMFKQLQEFQRQQQLHQLGDLRQQNSLNQFSAISRQATGGQFSPLINGAPVHDTSQMFMNWMQRGASPAAQGVTNKITFSQEQGQALHSMGLNTQQLDVSLYGTPISNTRGNVSQYSQLQGLPHESVNLLAKASSQVQKSMIQSSAFGVPYLGDQSAVPDLLGLSSGALATKQEVHMKNNFGQVPVLGLKGGVFPGNPHEVSTPQMTASVEEFGGRNEQVGQPAVQHTKQLGPSQGLVPLDPMEAKILYNMDDNIWDAFKSRPDTGAGGLGNTLEYPDSFPSIQSGSWSALMQSAVAEASSSDTGLQEEWNGLTFQNTEQSTDNQFANFVDSEKRQTGWVDNNLQSASSFSSKPFIMITDSSLSSSFPGFQQPGIQLSVKQREDICQDVSHESIENYNHQQKTSVGDGQKVQTIIHSDNAWSRQMFEHSQSTAQHQKGSSSDISLDSKGSKNIVKTQHQMSNDPHIAVNHYVGGNEMQEMQQNFQQRENSNDCSRSLSSHEQGHIEQLKFLGNFSSSAMSLDKSSSPDLRGISRAVEEVHSKGGHASNASSTFHGSILPDGSNVIDQTSEHLLELLHKVDQPKDDSTKNQFGLTERNPLAEMHGAESCDTSVAQMYAQSAASQGFGLRLAPPSQRLVNSSSFLNPPGLQQTRNDLNPGQVNPKLGEKNHAWLTPSSFQSSPNSHEQAQRAHWDNKSGTAGQTNFTQYMKMTGNTVVPFSPNLAQTRNQLQIDPLFNLPVTSHSLQAALPGATTRFPTFNQGPSQGAPQQLQTNAENHQFPILNTLPEFQPPNLSGVAQQGDNSVRPYNVWRNVPTQRQPSGVEPLKLSNSSSSVDPTNISMISTSRTPQVSHDQNSIKGGYTSSEVGASSNSQCSDHRNTEKEMLRQQTSSKVIDASCLDGASQVQEPVLNATAVASGLLVFPAQQQEQDRDKSRHSNNIDLASSGRNLEAFSNSNNDHRTYSRLHQVQAMNTSGEQQLHDNVSSLRHSVDGEPSSISLSNFPPGDGEMIGFPAEAGDGQTAKDPLQTALQSRPSQEMTRFGYNDSHVQFSTSNLLCNQTELGHANLHMAHSWFRQYGSLRNGQVAPTFDARLAATAALQLSRGKPSQNVHINTPLDRLDASNAGQGGRLWPGTAAALVASRQLSSPYMLSSEVADQVAIMRPKKRKISAFDLLPWHKKVTQESQKLQDISLAEEDWAQAMNRLIEKVEDEVDVIEDLQPMHRSKRRLILTTQLMQQLFQPAPASICSVDAASNYDIISFYVSRLSLGDACSLTQSTKCDFCKPVDDNDMNSQKCAISESGSDQKLLEIVEVFVDRANKLDSDFQRLDKAASFAEIRAEFQELERFAIINRFAKFHARSQVDASGTSSSAATKPVPQRLVLAFPMPRYLPEGVQCLSL